MEEVNKSKGGRPTIYSEEMVGFICDKVAMHAMSLRKICEKYPEMPNADTIQCWRWRYPEFSERYLAAKRIQAELMYDDCLEIADDGKNDYMESLSKDEVPIGWKLNGEHVQRSKLRIDTRMRLNARLSQNNNKPLTEGQSEIEKLLNEEQ